MKFHFTDEEKGKLEEISKKLKSYALFSGIHTWKAKELRKIISVNYPQLNEKAVQYITNMVLRFFYMEEIKKDPKRLEKLREQRKRFKEKVKADPVKHAEYKKKRNEYNKKYYKKHPEKAREYLRNAYQRRKKDPKWIARMKEYQKKYNSRPEVKKRNKKSYKKWIKKLKETDPEKYRRIFYSRRPISPTTGGVLCKSCGFKIKARISGRLGKRFIKCPKCRTEWRGKDLIKIKIERDIPKEPVYVPYQKEEKIKFYDDIPKDVMKNFKELTMRWNKSTNHNNHIRIYGHRRCRYCGSKEFEINTDSEGIRIRKVIHKENCPFEKRIKEMAA